MTYKGPYITAKMIFTQFHSTDFNAPPAGLVLWEELRADMWNFCPLSG